MHFEAALTFISRCGAEADVPQLIDGFLSVAGMFGFSSGAGGGWTGYGRSRQYRFYFNSWPADWMALYAERQVFFEDPMVLEAQRRMSPFRWGDLESHRSVNKQGLDILALARDYGWADGLVVPVHGPAGYQGLVSLASMHPLDLSPADISLLWVVAIAVHARCRETPGVGDGSPPPRPLNRREVECMRWVAAGKTDWEIGQLLQLSPATVHFHVEKVKRRLATGSRAEAVALLVLHGAL